MLWYTPVRWFKNKSLDIPTIQRNSSLCNQFEGQHFCSTQIDHVYYTPNFKKSQQQSYKVESHEGYNTNAYGLGQARLRVSFKPPINVEWSLMLTSHKSNPNIVYCSIKLSILQLPYIRNLKSLWVISIMLRVCMLLRPYHISMGCKYFLAHQNQNKRAKSESFTYPSRVASAFAVIDPTRI